MGLNPQKLRALVPRSIAARAAILIVLVTLSVALPGTVAHHLLLQTTRADLADQRDVFLSLAMAAYLEAGGGADYDQWLERIYEHSQRVRWAGVYDRQGQGVEFHRRTAMPRQEIVDQIDFAADEPAAAPLSIAGVKSQRFMLLTIPRPEQDVMLAAIIDRGTAEAARLGWAIAALLGAGAFGLILSFAWLQYGIQQPIQQLSRRLANATTGLTSLAADGPSELAGLIHAVEQTRRELDDWRGEATMLKSTIDRRVDTRTRSAARAQRAAQRDADTDPLTLLGNRRVLERDLPQLYQRDRRSSDELSIVLFDINHFKELNDTRGHRAGDELLQFVGELLRATVRRDSDLAIRYGGDEFVLVLPGVDATSASAIAKRIISLFEQQIRTMGPIEPRPGLSAGVAARREHGAASWEALLKMADAAMYWSKRTRSGVTTVRDVRAAQARGH